MPSTMGASGSPASARSKALGASPGKIASQITVFFLSAVGLFVLISQMIPQVSSYPPRALTREEFSKLSPEEMVAKGKIIFGASGERCSQCHMIEGAPGRGPNLGGIGARAALRAKERSLTTKKKYTAEEYLLESLIDPNAYVVEGFSSPSIMPQVYVPPLNLSEYDIRAAVAYLESLGGTVAMNSQTPLTTEWANAIAASQTRSEEPIHGDLAHGKDLFYNQMRCVACHQTSVQGQKIGGILGPDLSRVGEIRGPQSLKQIILQPPGEVMPKHYAENMTAQETNDLVVFLMSLRQKP